MMSNYHEHYKCQLLTTPWPPALRANWKQNVGSDFSKTKSSGQKKPKRKIKASPTYCQSASNAAPARRTISTHKSGYKARQVICGSSKCRRRDEQTAHTQVDTYKSKVLTKTTGEQPKPLRSVQSLTVCRLDRQASSDKRRLCEAMRIMSASHTVKQPRTSGWCWRGGHYLAMLWRMANGMMVRTNKRTHIITPFLHLVARLYAIPAAASRKAKANCESDVGTVGSDDDDDDDDGTAVGVCAGSQESKGNEGNKLKLLNRTQWRIGDGDGNGVDHDDDDDDDDDDVNNV
ncbi:unnamed protein product [Ceratitis capitata]|uniref:(Mediterranean fruit fly) hypothetical protein n=1 Tax=Ceratitis capitata TaxID=7213 RepID=A0A811V4K6_CERCA|nr:unnamed protein product [Ceratitis capitata]